MSAPKPVVLCILDGWGLSDRVDGNAPALAKTPTMDRIMSTCPHATLVTFGPDVGLPTGQMGNSEVGHTNIGAGRVVAMDLGQIDLAIEDGTFFENRALESFAADIKRAGGRAHIAGLASPGGVHSHQAHLIASARALADTGLEVLVHAFTDGRDVAPTSAATQIAEIEAALPVGARFATVTGRYFAMDRDARWDRVKMAFNAIAYGQGEAANGPVSEVVRSYYGRDKTDEFLPATVLDGYSGLEEGDGLFFVNFRADRAREILSALGDPSFEGFDRAQPKLSGLLGMVNYSEAHNAYMTTVFPKQDIQNTLGEWVASKGLRQFRLAETEKYPHVTFFLNGGREAPEQGEDRFMPKSPNVATYDLQPEMSSQEVTKCLVAAIKETYDLIVVNYANPDMVGHTGDLGAAVAACEAVDAGLDEALLALKSVGGAMIVCADHGNCEVMIDPETGGPHTAHTTNLVPVAVVGGPEGARLRDGRLADLAPTLLELMGIGQPPEMTGESLLS